MGEECVHAIGYDRSYAATLFKHYAYSTVRDNKTYRSTKQKV